jgi:predicted nuclease of predicted toxin-antitoxin system
VKLLLDEHLSRRLVPLLQAAFPGSTQIVLVGLERAADGQAWEYAKAKGFAVVSKDEDFQILSFIRGHPPKVIWIRSGNGPSEQILELLLRSRSIIENFEQDDDRSLLVLP